MVDLFVVTVEQGLQIDPNPEEVMDIEWIEYADLQKRIVDNPEVFTPWLRIYLADFSETIFGSNFGAN